MSELATLRIVVSADNAIRVVDQFGNAAERAAKQAGVLEKGSVDAEKVLRELGGTANDAAQRLTRSSDDIARAAGAIAGAFGATAAFAIVEFFTTLIENQRRAAEEAERTAERYQQAIKDMVNAGDVAQLTKLARDAFLGTPAEEFADGVQAQQRLVDSLRAAINDNPLAQLGGVFGGFERLEREEAELQRRLATFAELQRLILDTANVPFLAYGRDPITTTADAPGRRIAGVPTPDDYDRAVQAVLDQHHRASAAALAFRLDGLDQERAAWQQVAPLLEGGTEAVLNFGQVIAELPKQVSESERVLTEQLQLASAGFARSVLDGGLTNLPRFWDSFVGLGKDAISQVFAKEFMDRVGNRLGESLGRGLDGLGLVGTGFVGVFAGLASAIPDLIGSSKRAFEAAQAQRKAAEDLAIAVQQQRRNYEEDFLVFSGAETPAQRELREITRARDALFRRSFEQFRESAPNASSALFGSDFDTALARLRKEVAASGGYTTAAARTFLEQLEELALAFERNTEAAREAEAALEAERRARQSASLAAFADSLRLGPQSPLAPTAQLAEARRQYDAVLALAQGGDASAIDSLPETARTLLDASRTVFASGVRYADEFARVQQDVAGLVGDLTAPREDVERALAGGIADVRDGIVEMQDALVAEQQAQLAVQQEGFTRIVERLDNLGAGLKEEIRRAVFLVEDLRGGRAQ